MSEFLQSPAGRAVIGIVIALLAVLIIELNYRWFFKRAFDALFALIAIIVMSPVLIAFAIVSGYRNGTVLEKTSVLGKRGKIIFLSAFSGINGRAGRLARIFDVFCGRLSFVGVRPLALSDGALLSDEDMGRFAARPGLICHLILSDNENLTYEQAFRLDSRYARRCDLFKDIFAVVKRGVFALRGEGKSFLGETVNTYGEALLARGEITREDIDRAEQAALEAVENDEKRKSFSKEKFNGTDIQR